MTLHFNAYFQQELVFGDPLYWLQEVGVEG